MKLKQILLAYAVTLITFAGHVAGATAHFAGHCRANACKRHVVAPYNDRLNRMAWCESRRHWHLDALFDGGLQFHPATWWSLHSRFMYAWQAPVLEQKYRAVVWAHEIGWAWRSKAGWPACG